MKLQKKYLYIDFDTIKALGNLSDDVGLANVDFDKDTNRITIAFYEIENAEDNLGNITYKNKQ